ncbi:hypothetical protein BY458DRAFT_57318 [Sporodiniella umbellata]|nr:hypothetical protein BY458DRAFT_57318 [Sporodiniella umbellata]
MFKSPIPMQNLLLSKSRQQHPSFIVFVLTLTLSHPKAQPLFKLILLLVIHQGFPEEPPANFSCKDKFLFVSVLAEGELESQDVKEIWSNVEVNHKGSIHQQKLRVEYVDPQVEIQQAPVKATSSTKPAEPVPSEDSVRVVSERIESEINEVIETVDANTEGLQTQVRRLENELKRCREQIENMPTVQKTTESPVGMFVLFAMLALAIAYFVQKQQA